MDFFISHIKKFSIPIFFLFLSLLLFIFSFLFSRGKSHSPDVIFTTRESSISGQILSEITVDVAGEVNKPGVYSLASGSRVNDVLELAEGLTPQADIVWIARNLNRAQMLRDGDKLYIPSKNDINKDQSYTNSAEQSISSGTKININTASQSKLEDLPGVGEKTAIKIIEGRPYQSTEDLRSKKIVGDSVFTKIADLISTL